MLSDEQIDRYARHILLREVGGVGQEKLLAARVGIEGLGAVGGWLVSWLALAGVGRLFVDDPAPVGPAEIAPLLGVVDLGKRRDEAIAAALPAFNPDARIEVRRTTDDGLSLDLRVICLPPGSGEAAAAEVAGGSAVAALRLWAAGDEAWVLPPGAFACLPCVEGLPAGPPSAAAAALAGSVAGSEALLQLLGKGARPRPLLHFRAGEPVRCPHRR